MTKTKLAAVVGLVIALAMGGVATWHFTRPTVADTLTQDADGLLNDFSHYPPPEVTSNRAGIGSQPIAVKARTEPKPQLSHTYAVIRIPVMGLKFPIVEGTDEYRDLSKGVGHYVDTAQAGQVGNYALAGHVCCASNGQPFKRLYLLHTGDAVYVDTALGTYTYTVIDETACGESQQIVHMSKIQVINPVPCSNAKPTRKLMTLTTCKITERGVPSIMRRIVWAEFATFTPRS